MKTSTMLLLAGGALLLYLYFSNQRPPRVPTATGSQNGGNTNPPGNSGYMGPGGGVYIDQPSDYGSIGFNFGIQIR